MITSAINLARRLYIEGDQVFPITHFFDADGDECNPEDAVFAVAGIEGRWYALDLTEFSGINSQ